MSLSYLNSPLKSFPLDDLHLLFSYPIKPKDNVIYFFICHCNLPLDLFALGRRRQGVFLFVEFDHLVNERDEFISAVGANMAYYSKRISL